MGLPDPLKGHVPFAFIQPRSNSSIASLPATPTPELFTAVNNLVREHIGAIASLGGMIQGHGMIPKTRSGKTVRRVLRELLENAAIKGDYSGPVNVPPTVEDMDVVEVARAQVKNYFDEQKARGQGLNEGQALNGHVKARAYVSDLSHPQIKRQRRTEPAPFNDDQSGL